MTEDALLHQFLCHFFELVGKFTNSAVGRITVSITKLDAIADTF